MEIEFAIQELLSRLDFVSLPGLGSFVKKYESASLSVDGKLFNPPREYFIFDTKRVFNDEALENFVAENANVDPKNASAMVEQFVAGITVKLNGNAEVIFPGVGVLRKTLGGDIELVLSDEILSQTFGLGKLDIAPKATVKKTVEKVAPVKKDVPITPAKQDAKLKPVSTGKSKSNVLAPIVVVVAVIAIAAVLVFVPELRFWENMGDSSDSQVAQVNPVDESGALLADSTGFEKDSLNHQSDTATATVVQNAQPEIKSVIAVTDKKAALYYQETSQAENKSFYIIAGSFSQESNAQKLVQELSTKGYKPVLLQTDNMYRVAIYKFTNRDRALRELERLKAQKVSNKVWLLSI